MSELSVNDKLTSLNNINRSFFGLIVRPLVIFLWPRRTNWFVRNLANAISTFRLFASVAAVLLVVYPAYVNQQHTRLAIGLAAMLVLLLSDGIDGAIARNLDTVSNYGKAIDPLADKVFYLSAMAAACIGAKQLIHEQLLLSMLVVMLPALYYEFRLVAVAVITERECLKRNMAEPTGANTWGKSKFGIQAIAVFAVFGLPWPTLAFSIAISLVTLSLPFAHLSLRGHQLDLEAIRIKPAN
jgi:CDP-diacylglycerol--glycerol-3-phosphate 3-phosphatidyltransferase